MFGVTKLAAMAARGIPGRVHRSATAGINNRHATCQPAPPAQQPLLSGAACWRG
jgi:hypothetical protein